MAKKTVIAGIAFCPLTLELLDDLDADLEVMRQMADGGMTKERRDAAVRVFTASAQLADPNVTGAMIKKAIDISTFGDVTRAVYGLSGFQQTEASETARPTNAPNGAQSSPASLPQPDGTGPLSVN